MDLIESSVVENGVGEEGEFEKQDSGLINDDITAGNGLIRGHTVSDNEGKEEYAFYRSEFDENWTNWVVKEEDTNLVWIRLEIHRINDTVSSFKHQAIRKWYIF